MEELAKKLINDHRNPLVKVDVLGNKLFFKASTPEQEEFVERHQNNLEKILTHNRAERRCARAQALWLSDKQLAKVTKVVKDLLKHFGFQDKNGIFLYPEEALILLETNRLELTNAEVPLSIQEGYALLNKEAGCNLLQYRVYKKLVLLGYTVARHCEIVRRRSKNITKKKTSETTGRHESKDMCCSGDHSESMKRQVNESDARAKKSKQMHQTQEDEDASVASCSTSNNQTEQQLTYINNLFEQLRQKAPKEYKQQTNPSDVPDYCVFLPTNKSRSEYDFNLYICEGPILERTIGSEDIPSIYAICSEENFAFYRFANVHLPFL